MIKLQNSHAMNMYQQQYLIYLTINDLYNRSMVGSFSFHHKTILGMMIIV